jgi:hypothetical protein
MAIGSGRYDLRLGSLDFHTQPDFHAGDNHIIRPDQHHQFEHLRRIRKA